MQRTVDLVLFGEGEALLAAALEAIRSGRSVLVVMRERDLRVAGRIRRAARGIAVGSADRITVMTNAEVCCVDGIDGVEAVLVRQLRTGRLRAVNASAYRACFGRPGEER